MSDSRNQPKAISHKKLSYFLLNAQKDKNSNGDSSNYINSEKETLLAAIEKWEKETVDLINKISRGKDKCFEDKSPSSLMALGAMEAHLNMAIQALNAFKKDDDSN